MSATTTRTSTAPATWRACPARVIGFMRRPFPESLRGMHRGAVASVTPSRRHRVEPVPLRSGSGMLTPMASPFRRPGAASERDPRLPPGQYDTGSSFPVLTAEVSPRLDLSTWSFRVDGLVDAAQEWTWEQIHRLPASAYEGDIHCVTTWSKLGTSFAGVSVDDLLAAAGP